MKYNLVKLSIVPISMIILLWSYIVEAKVLKAEKNIFPEKNLISTFKIKDMLTSYLESSDMNDSFTFEINQGNIELDFKSEEYIAEIVDFDINKKLNRFSAKIIFKGEDRSQIKDISGKYKEYIKLPVLNVNLPAKTVIKEEHITWMNVDLKRTFHDTINDHSNFIGKMTKRRIGKNKPLRVRDVMKPALVKRNQKITLIYETPTIVLKTSAEAMEDGAKGEVIKVKNFDSKKVIYAKVTSDSTVKISPKI